MNGAPEPLLGLECMNCAINQVVSTAEIARLPRERGLELMQRAFELLARGGVARNNCIQIEEVYRMMTSEIGIDDPYREIKANFNRGMMRICPEVKKRVQASEDPLRAAVRAAIAGNLIDLAALGLDVSMDAALAKLDEVERVGMYIDHVDSLRAALSSAKTLLVLGDNCGEIALDRLLIEVIRERYPQLRVQYGVRGRATVNDVTREDAEMVGMGDVAEVIDNGDSLLTTMLSRTSPEFNRAFYAADVVIAKGMGNYEGLHACDRGNIWFLLISKCNVIARMTQSPRGSILCLAGGAGRAGPAAT